MQTMQNHSFKMISFSSRVIGNKEKLHKLKFLSVMFATQLEPGTTLSLVHLASLTARPVN